MPTLIGRIWDKDTSRPLAAACPGARVDRRAPRARRRASTRTAPASRSSTPTAPSRSTCRPGRPTSSSSAAPSTGPLRLTVDRCRATARSRSTCRSSAGSACPSRAGTPATPTSTTTRRRPAPLDRLRLDPRVEDLPVFIVSVLKRRELAYASNAFPIGRHALSTPEHVIDVGEESRHNDEPWRIGYGHIMLINIQQLVEPISRGVLVDDSSPDYPPLIDACDARPRPGRPGALVPQRQRDGGAGRRRPRPAGRPQPVRPVLDGPGVRRSGTACSTAACACRPRPARTGSSAPATASTPTSAATSRYETWLDALRAGRTFITDGPVLRAHASTATRPSNDLLDLTAATTTAEVVVEWEGAQPVDRVEIVRDGEVAFTEHNADAGAGRPPHSSTLDVAEAGWVAARCWGSRRTSYAHPLWAHTSPVYLRATPRRAHRPRRRRHLRGPHRPDAATGIATRARFDNASQRDRLLQLYAEGRAAFERLARP